MAKFRKYVLPGLGPLLFVLLIYSNSFDNDFQYDDIHSITRNPNIKNPENLISIFWSPQMGSGVHNETSGYRPLLMFTFALNYSLGGLNPFGFHLLNFLLHLTCAFFVFLIALNVFQMVSGKEAANARRNLFTALFAAVIFAAHPVQTESVTYITGRSSSLTALFFLAAFWAYMQYARTEMLRYVLLSGICYACALLVKEIAITLPIILILFDLSFPLKRGWRRRFWGISPFIGLSVIYLELRSYFFGSVLFSSKALRPFYDNLLTQLRAWVHYLKTFLFPINLSVYYDFPISHSILEPQVLLSIFILVTAVVAVWKISKHHRAIGFFALWFAVNLLPTNSLIPLEDVVTDRWLYLPSVGFAIILALFVKWIFLARVRTGSRARKLIFFFLCALILELYGVATLLRNITWSNDWMLWEDAVSKSPNKDRPHHELGLALMDAGQTEEAAREFKKVLEINPQHSVAYLNLGNTYLRQGKLAEAAENYQRALSMDYRPIAADIHNNLGAIYSRQGRLPEAIQEFQKSIAARPLNEVAYFNLGDIYERMGDMDRAISCMEKAVKITPEFFQGHKALHRLYEKKGWKEKSQEAYRKYLTYSPAAKFLPPARQNLK